MSNEAVCDITISALKDLLKNFPRKKSGFQEYCKENMIIEMEELSEGMALEVLEMLDSASYIRVIRAKEQAKRALYDEELLNAFNEYLADHNDDFIIVDQVKNCYLLNKRIFIHVQTKNNNSVFQPFERVNENMYFITVIVKLTEDFTPTPLISKFMSRNCKIIKLNHIDSVVMVLDRIS